MTRTMFAVPVTLAISFGMATFALTTLSARADILEFGKVDISGSDIFVGGGLGNPFGMLAVRGGSTIESNGVFIGGVASAVGTLIVDGVGSEVIFNGFSLPDFTGTNALDVGGEGHGALVIQNGGAVVPAAGLPYIFNFIANAAGSTGTVTVKGEFSSLDAHGLLVVGNGAVATFDPDGFDYGTAGAASNGTLNVLDGGAVTVNNLTLGFAENASGTVTVNGPTSEISNDPAIGATGLMDLNVGHGSDGMLNITNGGAVTGVLYSRIGTGADSSGVINVVGTDSLLSFEFDPIADGEAGFQVGRNGHGMMNISKGGNVTGVQFVNIGRGADGVGVINVAGELSMLVFEDEFGAGTSLNVGRSGHGMLSITDGGNVTGVTFANIGREAGSDGMVDVAGTGSLLSFEDNPAGGFTALQVGRFGHGMLSITNGGNVTGVTFATIGREAGSDGMVDVAGTDSLLSLEGCDGGQGAFLFVGRYGSGTINISDRGRLVIKSGDTPCKFAGLNVARNPESTGDIRVTGVGSEVRIIGKSGLVGVGRMGTGSLTVSLGGLFIIEDGTDGSMFVAPVNQSVGTIRVLGETKDLDGNPTGTIPTVLNTGGFLGLGVGFDRVSSAGVATLIIDKGGTVTAHLIEIGRNGTVFSNGTINGNVGLSLGGIFHPGFSPGTAIVNGILTVKSGGILNIEIFGTDPGEFDVLKATRIIFEEGSQLNLIIDDSVVGTVAVLEADQIDGTATITTTIVDESGATVSEKTTEDTPIGAGGNELALVIEVGGETEIVNGAAIDIKPKDPKNKLNSKSGAAIVVAMLANIAPSDVTAATFGPTGTEASAIFLGQSDVDGDGDRDLIARFRLAETGLMPGHTEACLTITLTNTTQLTGCDSVIVK